MHEQSSRQFARGKPKLAQRRIASAAAPLLGSREMLFEPSQIAPILKKLADENGIYIGTTSWKFPGWCGVLYDEGEYLWGNHFSKARFKRECLKRYAEVFRSVCVDSTYYHLPRKGEFDKLAADVPDGFRLTLKVPDQITIKNFPNVRTFGERRGKPNEYFLDGRLFRMGFLRPLEKIREKVGMLVFEFSHFHVDDFAHGREFVAALDRFFAELPPGWDYAVEVRNASFLHEEYFATLQRHRVAHVYNQWTLMPGINEQIALHPLSDNPFLAARCLLTPGLSRDWAQREFDPYHQLKEIDPIARDAMQLFVQIAKATPADRPAYLYVGNLLEGNALHTISDVVQRIL
jgi:uncharacterized protein YecE (DUF72 family)